MENNKSIPPKDSITTSTISFYLSYYRNFLNEHPELVPYTKDDPTGEKAKEQMISALVTSKMLRDAKESSKVNVTRFTITVHLDEERSDDDEYHYKMRK